MVATVRMFASTTTRPFLLLGSRISKYPGVIGWISASAGTADPLHAVRWPRFSVRSLTVTL